MSEFLRTLEEQALGRSPLLPPQPHQPVAAPAQRHQLPVRLRAAVHRPGRRRRWSAGSSRCFAARSATSSSSPRATTRSNQATHEYKEAGQGRLQPAAQGRPADALGAVAAGARRSIRRCLGLLRAAHRASPGSCDNVAMLWLALGVGGRAVPHRPSVLPEGRADRARVVTKILTDPFHDIKLYYKAPLYVLRGELLDPIVPTKAQAPEPLCRPAERRSRVRGSGARFEPSRARASPAGSGGGSSGRRTGVAHHQPSLLHRTGRGHEALHHGLESRLACS